MIRICGSCAREVYGDAPNCQHCGAPQPDAASTPSAGSKAAAQVPTMAAADVRATPYATPQSNVTGGSGQKTTPGIVIAGVILAFIPILCLNIVGAILGIVGLSKIKADPDNLKGSGLAITSIVVGFGWMAVGVLAAIAIPSFVGFQAKAKQSEAKVNLKGLYIAEQAFYAEHQRYGTLKEIDWDPTMSTQHYTYILGNDVVGDAEFSELDGDTIASSVDDNGFRAAAIGNIDSDETLDVWVIDHDNLMKNIIDDASE